MASMLQMCRYKAEIYVFIKLHRKMFVTCNL